jgi:type VI secretion system protein VasJ
LIPPPDEQVITVLRNLYKSGSWKELLQASEARVPEFLFWIDISRFSAESLQKLGFNDIARAVAMETSLYVGRLNGIEYLSFSDGTPFADDETREWLKGLDSRTERQQSFSVGYVVDNLQETLAKETAAALELVKEDKLPEALNDFRDKMNRASSAREFFIRETEFCKFLFRTKQAAISGPYVKELIDKIDIYKLDEWDPLLAVDALVTVLSGLRSQENGKDKELETNVMDRIAILSPARAVSLL